MKRKVEALETQSWICNQYYGFQVSHLSSYFQKAGCLFVPLKVQSTHSGNDPV